MIMTQQLYLFEDELDLTPEGYVREFVRNGSKSHIPLHAWEQVYQDRGLIEEAWRQGYIDIGSDVACTITLTEKGKALL